jgi:hypothetical protein
LPDTLDVATWTRALRQSRGEFAREHDELVRQPRLQIQGSEEGRVKSLDVLNPLSLSEEVIHELFALKFELDTSLYDGCRALGIDTFKTKNCARSSCRT